MATGSKYDKAVDRATNGGETAPTTTTGNLPVPNAALFIQKVDEKAIAAVLADPTLEFAPQVHTMEANEMVVGVLEGNGPEAEFEHADKATGVIELSKVKTWIIASEDGSKRISILSSVQLDRKLPPFMGHLVKIIRGEDENIGNGRRMSNYMVAGTKLSGGQRRSWAVQPAIEASSHEVKSLPAGDPATAPANHAAPAAS